MEIPVEHGGTGSNFMSAILVIEEFAKVDPAVSVACDVHNTLVNNLISFHGSDAIKSKYLPKLASEFMGSFCLSESASGSDAFAMQARAVHNKAEGTYTINGQKLWITNAGESGLFLVTANADPSKKHRGITMFVVDRDTPGLDIGPAEKKLGIRASSTHPVFLNDLVVPESAVLGEVGMAYKYAIEILNEGRIGIAAQMVGLAQGAFDHAMPYIHERKQFGTRVADFQGMQHQYGQMATEIEAARLLVYNAARLKMTGQPFVKEAAMAKLYASQVAEKSASLSIEWMGGVGFSREYPVEKFYRDAKIGSIYEGTSNIQKSTIAKFVQERYA